MNDQAASNGCPSVASMPQTAVASSGSGAAPSASTSNTTASNVNTHTTTMTMTAEAPPQESQDEVLTLTLRARPSVSWDNAVVDNEGLGRKSSKRCCIFHKQRPFGESSTDSSDDDSDAGKGSGDEDDGDKKPIASRKKGKKIARPKKDNQGPDYQRFHA